MRNGVSGRWDYSPLTVLDRATESVIPEPNTGCWLWLGGRSEGGYGRIWLDGRMAQAHRVLYEELRGPVPATMTIDHLCKTRACVNPAHMEIVSMKENVLRGESPQAINARKTHCPQGHALGAPRKNGRRRCGECDRKRAIENYYRKLAQRALGVERERGDA